MSTEENNQPGGLEALRAEARAVDREHAVQAFTAQEDSGQADQPGAVASVPAIRLEDELFGFVSMLSAVAAQMFPSLSAVLSEQVQRNIADVLAPVFRKRGWSTSSAISQWSEEIAAALVIVPVLFAAYRAVMADIAAANAVQTAAQEGSHMEGGEDGI